MQGTGWDVMSHLLMLLCSCTTSGITQPWLAEERVERVSGRMDAWMDGQGNASEVLGTCMKRQPGGMEGTVG